MHNLFIQGSHGIESSKIIEAAQIYKVGSDKPLSDYKKRINEEAGKLTLQFPSLLKNRGELLICAQQSLHDSGYVYKKGKSRSKRLCSSSDSGDTTPKRPKMTDKNVWLK